MSRISKRELRHRCNRIREAIPQREVKLSSRAVCDHLSNWPPFQNATSILSFLAFRNEIDLGQLFRRWPDKHWLVPRVAEDLRAASGQRNYLTIHPYDPNRLVRHRFGMLEPEPNLPAIDPDLVEVILVPGVAFDRQGGRLGFGGGFYDRLLPQASRASSVGVTYDVLVLDAIPMEPWDSRVDWLVSPGGLIRTGEQ